jgi:hypothetical protein
MISQTFTRITRPILAAALLSCPAARLTAGQLPPSGVDLLTFGSDPSEKAHALNASSSEAVKGLLDQPARRLLPLQPISWEGGRMSFTMKVDPDRQNYLTARLSGNEVNEDYLILFCEGKQVGYRHLGDIDVLALPDEEPRYNGRFYYATTPLPLNMTRGKSEVHLEIRSTGPIFGYGDTWEKYQNVMTRPSTEIYRLYTHTDGCFVPPADEKQGSAPVSTIRQEPGPEVLDQLKDKVDKALMGFLNSPRPINQIEIQFLARAYSVSWTPAYQSPKALQQVVAGVDDLYRRYKADPNELWNDTATWNPGWFAVGPAGDAVRRLAVQLQPMLDEKLAGGETRRAAWSEMFQAGRDWLGNNRRWLANQAMFTDTNLYLCNSAVEAVDKANALPETKALDYLYQAIGLAPWLGRDTPNGPEKLFGGNFYQVTSKGLTRERGYVGGYGEGGLEGAMDMYEATRDAHGDGDPKIKAQLIKMNRARAPFRYPMLDAGNHPAMRLETAVGWRDTHLPGDVTYTERTGNDHSPLQVTAATLDPQAIGYAQQMFADNQFFEAVASQVKDNRFRALVGLLNIPDDYKLVSSQPASPYRLPMSWDQPDFVFADEEDGIVAIKRGREILYASLYWRAGYAINFLARTHYITPDYQQVAVVREDQVKFEPSGQTYQRKDWINFGFGNGGTNIQYPSDIHQALAGEVLPIAKLPPDVKVARGDESHYTGKAEYYELHFGRYLIGMNTTTDKTFDLQVPAGAVALTAKATDAASGSIDKLGPLSTAVYYLSN